MTRAGIRRCLLLIPALVMIGAAVVTLVASPASAGKPKKVVPLEIARIYWEYNASANDLGVHVKLDGEDWKSLAISNPLGNTIFTVQGGGPYARLGMTELFFEGAEPTLTEFPLEDLLALFPEGTYEFRGETVDGSAVTGKARFSHAIPDGPAVTAEVGPGHALVIRWDDVTAPPAGFPDERISIVGYQVIIGLFEVTLPATANQVTVPPEFVASLASGVQPFEVLAIEASGNQTLTEGTFTIP